MVRGREGLGRPGHASSFSRRVSPEACIIVVPPGMQRVQGKPGAQRTHSLACEMKKHTSKSRQVRRNDPAFPARMVYGLWRALPGVHDLVVTVARAIAKSIRPRTWHQPRGARTTQLHHPHQAPLVSQHPCVHRIPHSTCRDDRDTPLASGRDARTIRLIRSSEKQKYFCVRGLTGIRAARLSGRSLCGRSVGARSLCWSTVFVQRQPLLSIRLTKP
jgi:hypothetical protein